MAAKGIIRTIACTAVFSAALAVALAAADAQKDGVIVPGAFVDIAKKLGIAFVQESCPTPKKDLLETMGSGVALLDYDNDGLLDIYLVNGALIKDPTPAGTIPQKDGPRFWNRLYHQKKDGTFEDVTVKAGVAGVGYGMGVAVGDYDNDGYEDMYVTAYGRNTLYHNNGDGTYTDVTDAAGVAGGGWSTSAAWVDYDNDGRLDLIVARYMKWDFSDIWCGEHREGFRSYCHPDIFKPETVLLYHNEDGRHFREVSQQAGMTMPGKGLGVAITDYDRDGYPDIFVANDAMQQFLFHNKKNGAFEEVALESEIAVDGDGGTYSGMGVDFADYNNDGWPDAIIGTLANQKYALYTNAKDGTFTYASYTSGLGSMTMFHSGWGLRFFDYDNDGWKDLIVAQSHVMDNIETTSPGLKYKEGPLLARNTGRGFVDVSKESGSVFGERWAARGLAVGDIDNDGRVDVVISTENGPAHVLRNQTQTTNHWISLKLVGHKSNRDGIGAEIRVDTMHGSQWITVTTAGSYCSASDPRAHFGLGPDAAARMIEIRWPSGVVQKLSNITGDRVVTVEEPSERKP